MTLRNWTRRHLIKIFSRIRFVMAVKTTQLLMIFTMIAVGPGFLVPTGLARRKVE